MPQLVAEVPGLSCKTASSTPLTLIGSLVSWQRKLSGFEAQTRKHNAFFRPNPGCMLIMLAMPVRVPTVWLGRWAEHESIESRAPEGYVRLPTLSTQNLARPLATEGPARASKALTFAVTRKPTQTCPGTLDEETVDAHCGVLQQKQRAVVKFLETYRCKESWDIQHQVEATSTL